MEREHAKMTKIGKWVKMETVASGIAEIEVRKNDLSTPEHSTWSKKKVDDIVAGCPGVQKKAGSTSSFPSGPPPQYSSRLKLFNFGVRMGSGAFSLVWPPASTYLKTWHIYPFPIDKRNTSLRMRSSTPASLLHTICLACRKAYRVYMSFITCLYVPNSGS